MNLFVNPNLFFSYLWILQIRLGWGSTDRRATFIPFKSFMELIGGSQSVCGDCLSSCKGGFPVLTMYTPTKNTPITDITQNNILRYKTIEDGSITIKFWIFKVLTYNWNSLLIIEFLGIITSFGSFKSILSFELIWIVLLTIRDSTEHLWWAIIWWVVVSD